MGWIKDIIEWYFSQMHQIGLELYVFLGMTIESSFIPFPSEIIVPPAAHQAGSFPRVLGLIAIGTLGSLVGGYINYFIGYFLGRPFFEKYGKYFLIGPKNLEKMDRFWEKYGEGSTLIGRLVPAVRQLISVPAGIARMNLWKFTLYTGLGAGFWVTVLALAGWMLRDWSIDDMEALLHSPKFRLAVLAFVVALVGGWIVKLRLARR